MGQTSSQIAASQSQAQAQSQLPEGANASTPRLDGAEDGMDVNAPAGKKRKVSAQGGQPAKRKRKDRTVSAQLRDASVEAPERPEAVATGPVAVPAEEATLKVKKQKKAKKQAGEVVEAQQNEEAAAAVRERSPNVQPEEHQHPPATQPEIADSQMDTNAQEASQPSKKTKRRKATGRKSGLNLAPAVLPEVDMLEVPDTQAGAEHLNGLTEEAAVPSPMHRKLSRDGFQFRRLSKRSGEEDAQDMPGPQSDAEIDGAAGAPTQKTKAKKRKKTKAASPAVEDMAVQDSQEVVAATTGPAPKKKTPKHLRPLYETDTDEEQAKIQQAAAQEQETMQHKDREDTLKQKKRREMTEAATAKNAQSKPKGKKGAQKRVEGEDEMAVLPTPPEATQEARGGSSTSPPNAREAPTPPTSVSGSGGLRADFSEVDATDQVAGWLDSQPEAGLAPVPSRGHTPEKRRKSKPDAMDSAKRPKRRRKSAEYDDDSDDFQPEDQENVAPNADSLLPKKDKTRTKKAKKAAAAAAKTPRADGAIADSDEDAKSKSTPVAKKQRPSTSQAENGIAKGPFTEAERNTVDDIFTTMLEDSSMNESDFRASIQAWREATDFKQAVHEALPHRPKPAIRKFCQRRYHNLERGAWTAEDDDNLRRAHATNPGAWTQISATVGRTAADCKDRWKNSLMLEKTMQLGPWSQDEEVQLTKAVDECVNDIKNANQDDKALIKDRARMESMISWATVAEKIGGTRSAKRCNEKWQKLKHRANSTVDTAPLLTGIDKDSRSKKLRQAEYRYNQCGAGDLYDILTEIHTAIPNHTQEYSLESTFWSRVSIANPNSKFNSAMRRRGYHDAAHEYEQDVELSGTMAAKAKAIADHLARQWSPEELEKGRTFVPKKRAKRSKHEDEGDGEEDGKPVERPPFANKKEGKAARKAAQQAAKAYKSAEKVEDSDSCEENDDAESGPDVRPSPDRKRRFSRGKKQAVEPIEDVESGDEIVVADSQPTPRLGKRSDGVTVPSAESGEMSVWKAKKKKQKGK